MEQGLSARPAGGVHPLSIGQLMVSRRRVLPGPPLAAGRALKVSHGGGEKTVVVPPETPVVTYAPGTRALLVKGAHLITTAARGTDGTLTADRLSVGADRLSVGKDGLVPPM